MNFDSIKEATGVHADIIQKINDVADALAVLDEAGMLWWAEIKGSKYRLIAPGRIFAETNSITMEQLNTIVSMLVNGHQGKEVNDVKDYPEIMNTEQVCKALSISRPTLYKLIKRGVITPLPQRVKGVKQGLQFRNDDVSKLLSDEYKEEQP